MSVRFRSFESTPARRSLSSSSDSEWAAGLLPRSRSQPRRRRIAQPPVASDSQLARGWWIVRDVAKGSNSDGLPHGIEGALGRPSPSGARPLEDDPKWARTQSADANSSLRPQSWSSRNDRQLVCVRAWSVASEDIFEKVRRRRGSLAAVLETGWQTLVSRQICLRRRSGVQAD